MKVYKNVKLCGELTDISVKDGKIAQIGKCDGAGVDMGGLEIYPGLIDVHCHGMLGFDTTDGEDRLAEMSDYLLAHGTTTWYPTTMTLSKEEIIAATSREINLGHGANIPGFHLEGPFIHPNYRGAQNPNFITAPDLSLIEKCKNVKRVTIAPELPGARKFIENCPAKVSIGHTDADYDTALGAFRAGAKCLTHTYNAMRGIHHRAPGPIGAASVSEGVFAELIADGFHVHPAAIKMLVKIMGEDRIILISDSVRPAGLPDGEYDSGGLAVKVVNGEARLSDGTIAGSTSTLFDCVKFMISIGYTRASAVKMASENPARHMGLNKGKIEVGYDADFIFTDADFNLKSVVINGELQI